MVYAAHNGHFNVVKFLCERGANTHLNVDSQLNYRKYIPERLVFFGISITDYHKEPAFICACCNGNDEIVTYLYEKGVNIHVNREDALQIASSRGHLNIVKFLVSKGAEINAASGLALKSAIANGHIDVVQYLHQMGASIPTNSTHDQDDLLLLSLIYGHLDITQYLINNGVNPVIDCVKLLEIAKRIKKI